LIILPCKKALSFVLITFVSLHIPLSGAPTYEESGSSALLTLFFYSALMFTVPLAVFFAARHFLAPPVLPPPWGETLAPVALAVLAANLIVVAYAYHAYWEDRKERESISEKKNT